MREKQGHPITGVRIKKTTSKGRVYRNLVYEREGVYYGKLYSDIDDLDGLNEEIRLLVQRKALKNASADGAQKTVPNSLAWLAQQYFEAPENKLAKKRKTLNDKRLIFQSIFQSEFVKVSPKQWMSFGDYPCRKITAHHVKQIRDSKLKAGYPGAAENRLRAIKELYNWAMKAGNLETPLTFNPAQGVERQVKVKITSRPRCKCCRKHHTWEESEIQQWEKFYPIGTKPRLWLDLHLYTGLRISDVERLGPPMVNREHNCLEFVEYKNQTLNEREGNPPKFRSIPILPELQHSIDRTPTGIHTFLVTQSGTPYGYNSLNNDIRKWRRRIVGFPEYCTSHGLRKAACCRMMLAGASDAVLLDVFGWQEVSEIKIYAEKAIREKGIRSVRDNIHLIGIKRA